MAAPTLRAGLRGVLLGGVLYMAADTGSDLYVFSVLRHHALSLAAGDEQLAQLLGSPLTAGAWYDSTLAFSHRERVAHATVQLRGPRGVTDVSVRAGRRQEGPRSAIWYNILGPAEWRMLSCQAMVPAEGGLVTPRSLIPDDISEEARAGPSSRAGGAAHGHALPAPTSMHDAAARDKQQQQQGRSSGWWHWMRMRRESAMAGAGGVASGSGAAAGVGAEAPRTSAR
jgi:hypothetical protein